MKQENENKVKLTKEEFEPALQEVLSEIHDKITVAKAKGTFEGKSKTLISFYREGKLNATFVILEMPKLQNKTSTLSRSERDILGEIISKSIKRAYLKQIKGQADKGNPKKTKSKK